VEQTVAELRGTGLELYGIVADVRHIEVVRNGTALTIEAKENRHFAWGVQVQDALKEPIVAVLLVRVRVVYV
jgi:hypothetical protein